MLPWPIPGVPPVPNAADLMRLMQTHAELLAKLPETLAELTQAVQGIAETAEVTKRAVASANALVERLDVIISELEEPVLALRPGIERVGEVLEAPVVERLPMLVESIEAVVLPVADLVRRFRRWVSAATRWRDRGLARPFRSRSRRSE